MDIQMQPNFFFLYIYRPVDEEKCSLLFIDKWLSLKVPYFTPFWSFILGVLLEYISAV